ncbi:hypothetical protein BDDG_12201 [Blastomyces dermatitidis ATCC 18188]|uniref:Uncharacterized protein n=1 Tax=Ajellomyces dermatitidis (strain ATCC 18188 / CBS 674.68) TaxID=653446 RepID=A0A0J9ER11_AJEDA|nr:hypothetical protein BDDG_12201 [Blastomyces dermatitidis ATCC 18188]
MVIDARSQAYAAAPRSMLSIPSFFEVQIKKLMEQNNPDDDIFMVSPRNNRKAVLKSMSLPA